MVGQPSIVSEQKFRENLNNFVLDLFNGVDMSNVVIAGGCVLSCILPGYAKEEYKPDQMETFENQIK